MNNARTLLTWMAVAIAAAGVTILAVQALNKPLGLQPKVASFGKPR